jgi:hypothetical protein
MTNATVAQAADLANSVHAGAVLAVRVLDQVAATWIDSRTTPTASELEIAKAVTGALAKARDALNATATVEQQVLEVAKQLKLATDMLAAVGVTPPPETDPVLQFIEAYARARGAS